MEKTYNSKERKAQEEIIELYQKVKGQIESRLAEFARLRKKGNEEDVFSELVFCLLTPQSKARSCDHAVDCLLKKDLILRGSKNQIAKELRTKTRFHNNKAGYIVEAGRMFTKKGNLSIIKHIEAITDPKQMREWLVKNIKGLGYKEASHFLRNIGMGESLAILDRHILKNLVRLGVIPMVPDTLSSKKYIEIEEKMKQFAKKIEIPLAHLDLLLWYKETGEVFK